MMLKEQDKIIVSKLAAILKVAESLDISHKKKIKELKLSISGNEIIFNILSKEDLLLEEWNFEDNINYFEEVLALKPIIKRRK
jgi:exopolyphosphatase/guanosine-5'-triphosphate,3'-diphosphate pyrophosphatase